MKSQLSIFLLPVFSSLLPPPVASSESIPRFLRRSVCPAPLPSGKCKRVSSFTYGSMVASSTDEYEDGEGMKEYHSPSNSITTMLLVVVKLFLICASKSAVGTKGYEAKSTLSTQSIQAIVQDIQKWQENHSAWRPFVTVTYAQSIDGKIALLLKNTQETSSNFALSDPESFRMTHALRSIHDAILVGGRTLSMDNPQLNNRLWNPKAGSQPRPIVLDTHLSYIQELGRNARAKNLIICCSPEAAAEAEGQLGFPELLPCPINPDSGKIDLRFLLRELKTKYQVESLMVEGGASVLTEFYHQLDLVDCLCITIAPKLLLQCGLPAIIPNDDTENGDGIILNVDDFESTQFFNLSKDSIFLAKLLHETKKQ